jgi:hypothetical protein
MWFLLIIVIMLIGLVLINENVITDDLFNLSKPVSKSVTPIVSQTPSVFGSDMKITTPVTSDAFSTETPDIIKKMLE